MSNCSEVRHCHSREVRVLSSLSTTAPKGVTAWLHLVHVTQATPCSKHGGLEIYLRASMTRLAMSVAVRQCDLSPHLAPINFWGGGEGVNEGGKSTSSEGGDLVKRCGYGAHLGLDDALISDVGNLALEGEGPGGCVDLVNLRELASEEKAKERSVP
eukprot:6177400-Pleurochrysis_carterae.AAC.2